MNPPKPPPLKNAAPGRLFYWVLVLSFVALIGGGIYFVYFMKGAFEVGMKAAAEEARQETAQKWAYEEGRKTGAELGQHAAVKGERVPPKERLTELAIALADDRGFSDKKRDQFALGFSTGYHQGYNRAESMIGKRAEPVWK